MTAADPAPHRTADVYRSRTKTASRKVQLPFSFPQVYENLIGERAVIVVVYFTLL